MDQSHSQAAGNGSVSFLGCREWISLIPRPPLGITCTVISLLQLFKGAVTVVLEDGSNSVAIEVMDLDCDLYQFPWQLLIVPAQWTADSVTDMYADAVLAVVLQIQSNPDGLEGVLEYALCCRLHC